MRGNSLYGKKFLIWEEIPYMGVVTVTCSTYELDVPWHVVWYSEVQCSD